MAARGVAGESGVPAPHAGQPRGGPPADTASELQRVRELRHAFRHAAASPPTAAGMGTRRERAKRLVAKLERMATPLGVYLLAGGRGEAAEGRAALLSTMPAPELLPRLRAAAQAARRSGRAELWHQAHPQRILAAIPLGDGAGGGEADEAGDGEAGDGEVLAAAFPAASGSPVYLLSALQLLADQLVQGGLRQAFREEAERTDQALAAVELLELVLGGSTPRDAAVRLANEVQRYTGAHRVACGWRRRGRIRLEAISELTQFDSRAARVALLEAALEEAACPEASSTTWLDSGTPPPKLAPGHAALARAELVRGVCSIPLVAAGEVVGVVTLLDNDPARLADGERWLRALAAPLGEAASSVCRAAEGPLTRAVRGWTRRRGHWRLAMLAAAAAIAAMFAPCPDTLTCDCRLEPVTRRFVAAPFEGTLAGAEVQPGDMVHAGDILARLDGREIRWQHAAVTADLNRALKKRDAAQASHQYAEQRIAELETQRLQLELDVLAHRAKNLEIRAPIDGIVLSGDLQRAAGAPVQLGQSLFELAPLDALVVELAIPDAEISRITPRHLPARVRLDAYPGEPHEVTVDRVSPRAELRDDENVFIAEAALDNARGLLRPGMKGRARLSLGQRPLGWVLFHKPWNHLTKRLAW